MTDLSKLNEDELLEAVRREALKNAQLTTCSYPGCTSGEVRSRLVFVKGYLLQANGCIEHWNEIISAFES